MSQLMKKYTDEDLESAVMTYVDALTLDDLVSYVAEDIYLYYKKSADTDEVLEFLHEMQGG